MGCGLRVECWEFETLVSGLRTLDSSRIHVSMSCWKLPWVFRFSVTTTMGRLGKIFRSRVEKKGCAGAATPAQDSAPPCSNRRARDCTAGVCDTRSNKTLAAGTWKSCAKQGENRRRKQRRQVRDHLAYLPTVRALRNSTSLVRSSK